MRGKRWIRPAIIILAAAAVLIAGLIILKQNDDNQYQETRGTMSEGFGQLKTVDFNGKKYREKPAVTTLLIAGIDINPDDDGTRYRDGGPADFLLLLAIDNTDKKIHQLQIDRDTMTDVVTLGVFGNETGTRNMQICLSHCFGKTEEDRAKYTIRAIQNVLDGLEVDGYYMVDYNAVPVVNDALGGVTVKIEFDMTNVNPAWTKGTTVTLHGSEAADFVRARMTVGEGTNRERMVRQNEFMQNAVSQMNKKIKADLEFADTLVSLLQDVCTTNMTTKRLVEELKEVHGYQTLPVDHPEGEYTIGSDGYVEFHMKEGAAVEWVLQHLYTEVQ